MLKDRRKIVIVNGKMQAQIVIGTAVPMFVCLLGATLLEWIYFQQVAQGNIDSGGTIFGMPESRLGMLLIFVAASMVHLTMALIVSQRVAGTAYHVSRILREYRDGNRKARVHLRKGDYQVEMADRINEFLDSLDEPGPATAEPRAQESLASKASPGSTPVRRPEAEREPQ